ncbi:MAG: Gfo/Idh/MocA family oxidoreductase, partial [Planctomycetes bacterium]|nr:Gfo/Idh/MocA family oxidoreductase [Planctomycetota bacterium]
MNVSPEDRAVGKENFQAVLGSELLRGARMLETAEEMLASGQGMGARYFGYGTEVSPPVRIGIIGTGDEGGVLIGALNPRYVQVVAIADIRPFNVYRAFHGDKSSADVQKIRSGLIKKYGYADEEAARSQIKVYTGKYEELLNDPNVEAVIIALPLHLHAEASIKAMRKGKHVLCEKLMAYSVRQCKEVARVAKETGKILIVGHQRHYSMLYDNAVELVKQGLIGDIHHIRAQWHRLNDTWKVALPDEKMRDDHEKLATKVKELRKKLVTEEGKLKAEQAKVREELKAAELESLVKSEKDCEYLPAAITALEQKIAEVKRGRPETISQLKPLRADLVKKQRQLVKATAECQKRLKCKSTASVANLRAEVEKLATREEILVNKLKDAQLQEKVKDYGYKDRVVGGKNISALAELIQWRLWNTTGGGLMAELGSHQLDASGIFISCLRKDGHKVHPLSVSAVGGRHIYEHDRDIDDHVYCSYEYPGPLYDAKKSPEKKIVVTYSSINGNGFGDYGETVIGTRGVLVLDREKDVMLFRGSSTGDYVKLTDSGGRLALSDGARGSEEASLGSLGLPDPPSKGYTEEIEHW